MDERTLARLELVLEIIRGAEPDMTAETIVSEAKILEAYVFGK